MHNQFFTEAGLNELYDVTPNGKLVARVAKKSYPHFGGFPCDAFKPRRGSHGPNTSYNHVSAIASNMPIGNPGGDWLVYRNTGFCNTVGIGYRTRRNSVS